MFCMSCSASAYPFALSTAACWSPSAFSISDCFAPSALSISDCFSPSATVIAASRCPLASSTIDLLMRSADICRVIASCMSLGGSISRISTFVTLMPHRPVSWSSLVLMSSFMRSRCDRTSSRLMSPTTALSVVVASPTTADVYCSTSSTAR